MIRDNKEGENLDKQYHSYLDMLGAKYRFSSEEDKRKIVSQLEIFVGLTLLGLGEVKSADTSGDVNYRFKKTIKLGEEELQQTEYDGKTARKIRLEIGLSPTDVANHFGFSRQTLHRFEGGKIDMKKVYMKGRDYLKWLRDSSGYNPLKV